MTTPEQLQADHEISQQLRVKGYPNAPWENSVLKTFEQRDRAIEQVTKLGLPLMRDLPKNWDSLAAIDYILKKTNNTAHILDAGAEFYSVILPWLALYGYKNLSGINLVFKETTKQGAITYEHGDITKTKFEPATFDAITCISVIEHGVDISSYFKEMSRILKPNGILITSTDYYEYPVDTKGQEHFGVPIRVFTKEEILAALDVAKEYGLELTSPLDLKCQEKVVHWKDHDLHYTFLIFTMQKKA